MDDQKDKSGSIVPFTLDPGRQDGSELFEVPSITRLLNRKKLKSQGAPANAPHEEKKSPTPSRPPEFGAPPHLDLDPQLEKTQLTDSEMRAPPAFDQKKVSKPESTELVDPLASAESLPEITKTGFEAFDRLKGAVPPTPPSPPSSSSKAQNDARFKRTKPKPVADSLEASYTESSMIITTNQGRNLTGANKVNMNESNSGMSIPTSFQEPSHVAEETAYEEESAQSNDYEVQEEQEIDSSHSAKPETIQASRARKRGVAEVSAPLVEWNKTMLADSKDPLAKGLNQLIEHSKKNLQGIFLALQRNPLDRIAEGQQPPKMPQFIAKAAYGKASRFSLWAGLNWDPNLFPDLWDVFVRDGLVELTPPGTMTVPTSQRNLVRGAFGVQPQEWLTLVRVGTADSCRGILVMISNESLKSAPPEAFALIGTLSKSALKAA